MILGDKKYFTKEHFEENKGFAPAYLCELVVYCLELVSQLSFSGLQYRFKGGNSQLLLLNEPQRFSIDVDIATEEKKDNLIDLVDRIVNSTEVFTRCEIRQHKTKPWLPMISFKLYFNSFYQEPEESYVMLDAIIEKSPYDGVIKKVKCLNIYESEEEVEVPTISGLIADKILTIGPSTLGIPLGKNKEAQRLKHIFDISNLYKNDYSIEKIRIFLKKCIIQENKLQRKNLPLEEVFKDTIKFCSESLSYDKIPPLEEIKDDPYLYEIVKGFGEFKNYLFTKKYSWNSLKNDFLNVIDLMNEVNEEMS
jgi:hypothetical protein